MKTEENQIGKLFYTVTEAGEILGLGRTSIYRLIDDGDLLAVKIGRSRRISKSALEDFAENISAVS
jgi:excisionase family DNA binding protein